MKYPSELWKMSTDGSKRALICGSTNLRNRDQDQYPYVELESEELTKLRIILYDTSYMAKIRTGCISGWNICTITCSLGLSYNI